MDSSTARHSKLPWILLGIVVLLIGSCTLTTLFTLSKTFDLMGGINTKSFKHAKLKHGKSIAYFTIEGVIYGSREDIFDSLEDIEEGVEDNDIAGVMLFINSPGGSVAPTQDIYHRILEIRKKVPVVCSLGDVAASGGYYLATACEEIYAQPGTTTGSIGVIFQLFNLENLANWAKVKPVTIKAGKLKDIASPFRPMTNEEKEYLQRLLDQVHEQFIRDVASGRANKITEGSLRKIADGRILTGEEALKLGLVDKSGGPRDALSFLKKDKNLGEKSDIIRFPRPRGKFEKFFASAQSNIPNNILEQVKPFMGMVPMLLPTYLEQFSVEAR
jgi:protease-4